ncbi:MAG: sugar-binding protein [Treponema sp.]|nr:sugar-binding protein [Treponema sp.]
MKRFLLICLIVCSVFVYGFSKENSGEQVQKIGVSLPTQRMERWERDGLYFQELLENAGYSVDLKFAEDDVQTQINQLQTMIEENCRVLVITPVNAYALCEVLETAKEKDIKVISYERLIMNTDAVSYFVTFSNYRTGAIQAEYLIKQLNIKKRSKKKPVYMEFFTGDIRDPNVEDYFNGAMDVLNPYIKKGIIVCRSNQTTIEECEIEEWSREVACFRMLNLIWKYKYSPTKNKLDAVLCSNDSTAAGVTDALFLIDFKPEEFPLITGQDCNILNVKNIIDGTQSMSILKDPLILVSKICEIADEIIKGKNPKVNEKETYDNGAVIVPGYLCDPIYVTKENYKKLLIDTNFYTPEDLQ